MLAANSEVSQKIARSAPTDFVHANNERLRSRHLRILPVGGKRRASRSVDFSDERKHFSTLYSISDRNVAADGRHPVRRAGFLPVASGGTVAPGRFPDHPGLGLPARR